MDFSEKKIDVKNLIVSNDEDIQRAHEKKMLKGKSMHEKMILLNELQKAKEMEMHTLYRMDRQQLRHDEVIAKRRIEEHENANNVIKNIYEHEGIRQSGRSGENSGKSTDRDKINVQENDIENA